MNDTKKEVYIGGGISFGGLLQLLFIALKLIGVINWSWWLVLLPAIIYAGVIILALIILGIVALSLLLWG